MSIFAEFLRDLRQQKLRTFLTVFGIMWGTISIVVLLSFTSGFKVATSRNMHGMGEKIVIMFPGRTSKPYQGFTANRWIRFTEDDVLALKQEIKAIKNISPEYTRWNAMIRYRDKSIKSNISGCYPIYEDMRNEFPEPGGRFINDMDMQQRRRTVFIGNKLRDFLFGENAPAVGEYIQIDEVPFLVVGVLKKKIQTSNYSAQDEDRTFIATSTFKSIYGYRYLNNIIYSPVSPELSADIKKQVYEVFSKRYRFDPTDEQAIWIWDTNEFDQFLYSFFLGFNVFMGIIGAFTLIVGGIGVANIMFVVVQERTHEIGIKRSVGARKHHILTQFFAETFFIIGIGAVTGFLISIGIIKLLGLLPIEDYVGRPILSLPVTLTLVIMLSLVGFVAGFFPARKAANLNIVDCLRY